MTEIQLTDNQYIQFRDLLLNRCGLDYPTRKRNDLAHSIGLTLIATGYPDPDSLYSAVVAGGQAWEALLVNVTIGETYFFRNAPQFAALRERILPDVVQRRMTTKGIRIWSAGCATGEEPYSLAMLANDHLPDRDNWQISILATDINPEFLARAQEGVYGAWSFRETSDTMRSRYFTPEGLRWRLASEIRRMVRFMRLNLAEPSYPNIVTGTCAFDIILCRNVTIYFDAATTRQVVGRFYDSLVPGGWLIVGHAEPQASVYHQFEVHNFPDTVVYRKPLNAPLFTVDRTNPPIAISTTPKNVAPHPILPTAPIPLHTPKPASLSPLPKAVTPQQPPTPVIEAEVLLRQARQAADRGDWTEAEQQCVHIIEQAPLRRDAHYLLAQIHEHHARLDQALASYRRAMYLDRTFVLATIGMAQVWQAMGRIADAQRSYRNALKQLALQPANGVVTDGDGMTYGDLRALVMQHLAALEGVV